MSHTTENCRSGDFHERTPEKCHKMSPPPLNVTPVTTGPKYPNKCHKMSHNYPKLPIVGVINLDSLILDCVSLPNNVTKYYTHNPIRGKLPHPSETLSFALSCVCAGRNGKAPYISRLFSKDYAESLGNHARTKIEQIIKKPRNVAENF
jgi:hypothetical protein